MVNSLESGEEALADLGHVAERQVAFVQLAIVDDGAHDAVDHLLELHASRVLHAARGRLDAVGHHDDGRLTGLRAGAGIAEEALVGLGAVPGRSRLRLLVEDLDEAGSVVLRDHVHDVPGEVEPLGSLDSLGDVPPDDVRALFRGEQVMWRLAPHVLDEVPSSVQLADVVVEGRGGAEGGVRPDGVGGGLGEHADRHAVLVGARGGERQLAQHRVVALRQFHEAHVAGALEDPLQNREQQDHERPGQQAAGEGADGLERQPAQTPEVSGHQFHCHDQSGAQDADEGPDAQQLRTALGDPVDEDGAEPRQQGEERQLQIPGHQGERRRKKSLGDDRRLLRLEHDDQQGERRKGNTPQIDGGIRERLACELGRGSAPDESQDAGERQTQNDQEAAHGEGLPPPVLIPPGRNEQHSEQDGDREGETKSAHPGPAGGAHPRGAHPLHLVTGEFGHLVAGAYQRAAPAHLDDDRVHREFRLGPEMGGLHGVGLECGTHESRSQTGQGSPPGPIQFGERQDLLLDRPLGLAHREHVREIGQRHRVARLRIAAQNGAAERGDGALLRKNVARQHAGYGVREVLLDFHRELRLHQQPELHGGHLDAEHPGEGLGEIGFADDVGLDGCPSKIEAAGNPGADLVPRLRIEVVDLRHLLDRLAPARFGGGGVLVGEVIRRPHGPWRDLTHLVERGSQPESGPDENRERDREDGGHDAGVSEQAVPLLEHERAQREPREASLHLPVLVTARRRLPASRTLRRGGTASEPARSSHRPGRSPARAGGAPRHSLQAAQGPLRRGLRSRRGIRRAR